MDVISLSLLFGLIVVSDQILNSQFQMSRKLLNWLSERTERLKAEE
ncbi:MAG: hypothetical protein AAFO04_12425 [Cyanobacteria bacterium J06592_8]